MVPTSPGGGFDAWARTLAPFIEKHLPNEVSVNVRNVPGAGGLLAARQMYSAEPDGTRIDMLNLSGLVAANLGEEEAVDLQELTYLGTIGSDPLAVAVNSSSPVENVEGLEAAASFQHAITGYAGSSRIVTIVVFDALLGLDYEPVTHDGSSEAILSTIRGDTLSNVNAPSTLIEYIDGGELRPVLAGEPLEEGEVGYEEFQDVQTLADVGFPELGTALEQKRVIVALPGLPEEIEQILSQVIQDALADPELLEQVGNDPQFTMSPLNAAETREDVNNTLDALSEYEDVIKRVISEE